MRAPVGVVVPAFRPDVDRLVAYLDSLRSVVDPAVIRVELDDPATETVAVLEELEVDLAVSPVRRGKGAAITAGFDALDTDVRVFVDADGAVPAESVQAIVAVVSDDTPVVVGSRRHPRANVQSHQTYLRRWLGDVFAWGARRFIDPPLYDYQCGAKVITAAGWEQIRSSLCEPGFAWDVEFVAMAAAHGLGVKEVPVTWNDQPESTVDPVKTSIELARALVTVRHRSKVVRKNALHTLVASASSVVALVDREHEK